MKLSDFTGVLQKHTLPLMRSYEADDDCTVFEFDITGMDVIWKPGQHGIFTLPEKDVTGTKWRAFSVSSIPSEGMLQIATKISIEPSSFKVALRSLQPGENIQIQGPFGWLYLRDHNSPVVMIAGGVGITPFRALFKELEQVNHRDVTLIYSSRDTYLFKSELDEIAENDPKIKIVYTHTKEEVDAALSKTLESASSDTDYFISGTPGMVSGISKTLKAGGVPKKDIITDSFKGY